MHAVIGDVSGKVSACANVERMKIRGHTDRLGAPQYNRRLSERRANAVANYLRNKVDFAKIETFGLGAAQPSTYCKSRLPPCALIDCLAPDRRVVSEIQGIAK
ncbi:OmpA family protein [Noviherbaspirillum sp. CPCC 100848]|uniref:OmpA family protein n=1 Tax=Noviherbaspirillum album TaxID=3080276 RepID=A0ABU6J4V8_9BURK|nr:OmpA family protein [Noviherbaspirillum sp. CPCC 100848]MEC4718657.1 OmpA family protein [Noviherbaspirillum sp. CPCC 100848]